MTKEIKKDDFENALNTIKKAKETKGIIPGNNKKIIIKGNSEQFTRKTLRIDKRLFKDGENYLVPAGTKWEEIDNFHRKNISFSKADFD